ncbi:protein FAM133 isoform X2 [Juglans regia]|uniref:Protein FAM133 isoform X2 n=1 Tax=Juglans regia TaxID=51240 RepID=A0A6P9E7X0_JUGRE|nr:protein FAM133 isoform X2 [Juglans regia]
MICLYLVSFAPCSTSYPPIFLVICNLIGQMDLETENRIAAMLMKEAADLRRQAEKEGVHAYLKQPNSRFRPNSRFLTATVLGVQQANRAVEVNEMWRARQKELELDDRCKGKFRNGSSDSSSSHIDNYGVNKSKRTLVNVNNTSASCSSSERVYESGSSREDEELEEFLHSRAKRGRGGVGPRMDETGPYLPPSSDLIEDRSTNPDVWRRHVVYGPEKPWSLKSRDSSEEETNEEKRKKSKKLHSGSTEKQHSRKHRSKDNSKDKKKKRKEEKRNKHRK